MFAADDRLYLQPTAFVARPHGLDGRATRLAGGLVWFSAWQVIARPASGGPRSYEGLVSVSDMPGFVARLSDEQRIRAQAHIAAISRPRPMMQLGDQRLHWDTPHVMGIVNMTPDSFSDGGKYGEAERAAAAGFAMRAAGVSIVDVGGESTRPGAAPVWEGDEIARIVPVVEALARGGVPVSIDSRKAAVMGAALTAGAVLINDIAALAHDDRALPLAVRAACPAVLMHAPSQGDDPHRDAGYTDVLLDVFDWLETRIAAVLAAGLAPSQIIVDPGLGFGKSLSENLALANGIALFHGLGHPVLVGASRKRMIGALDGEAAADDRLGGSVALHLLATAQGAQIVRVHDVRETVQALRVWRGLRDVALTAPYPEA